MLIHTLLDRIPREVVAFYDQRGGMEVKIKEDKAGLQLVKRRKQCWEAQAAWVILTDLSHDLLRWSYPWMWCESPFADYGYLRLIQDVLCVPGRLEFGGPKGSRLRKGSFVAHPPLCPCIGALYRTLVQRTEAIGRFSREIRPMPFNAMCRISREN